MSHFERHLRLPNLHSMADVQPNRTLLNVELQGLNDSRKISGTTDIVIAKSTNIENDVIRNLVEALLELKKPQAMQRQDHAPQTITKHLAASHLNKRHDLFSVLTDLNSSWTFFWHAEAEDGSGVALHKFKLQPDSEAARLGKHILESFNNEAC